MPLFIVMILLQVGLAVHCVRTGRESFWLYFILFVPLVGGLAYVITQVLPDMGNSPRARKTASSLRRSLDPHKTLRARKLELERSDSYDNRLQLAHECMEVGFAAEAETLYSSCLNGMNATDPAAMLGLANAQFDQEKFQAARQTLDKLIEANPEFRSQDGHMLYARTLEALNDPGALEEYAALAKNATGEEARVRYAELLAREGDGQRALEVIDSILERVRLAPKHYGEVQSDWIKRAEKLQASLQHSP